MQFWCQVFVLFIEKQNQKNLKLFNHAKERISSKQSKG